MKSWFVILTSVLAMLAGLRAAGLWLASTSAEERVAKIFAEISGERPSLLAAATEVDKRLAAHFANGANRQAAVMTAIAVVLGAISNIAGAL